MKNYLGVVIVIWVSTSLRAGEMPATPVPEGFIFKSNRCQLAMVNLKNQGELLLDKGEVFDIICELNPVKPFEVQCSFFQKGGNKPFAQKTMNAAISGVELFLDGSGDGFVANLTSQVFYGDANVILNNGLIRGHKICSGVFMWQHELRPAAVAPSLQQSPKETQPKADIDRFYRS